MKTHRGWGGGGCVETHDEWGGGGGGCVETRGVDAERRGAMSV